LPFFAILQKQSPYQAQAGRFVGKDTYDPGATSDFSACSHQAVGGADLAPIPDWKVEEHQSFWYVFPIQSTSWEAVFSYLRTKKGQMGFDRCAVWGIENRSDVSGYVAQPDLARHIRTGILLTTLLTHKVEQFLGGRSNVLLRILLYLLLENIVLL